MTCQLCKSAYESGRRDGERDGLLAVARELAAFGSAITEKAGRMATDGNATEALRLLGAARAISDFTHELVARTQREFG